MARMARAPGPALPAWLRRLAWIVLAAAIVLAVFLILRTAVLAPYADALDWFERWRTLQMGGSWADFLLAPHNNNRMGWTMALVAFDLGALGGTNLPLMISGTAGLALLAILLAQETARAAPPPLPLPAAVAAAVLVLNPANLLNASTPINATYVHASLFAVAAILLADSQPRPGLGWRRLTGLLAAVGAAFGSGVGLVVWPVLAISALRRRDWTWAAVVLLAGAAVLTFYAAGQAPPPSATGAGLLDRAHAAAGASLTFLALPWARLGTDHAWMAGLVIGAMSLVLVAVFGGRHAARPQRTATSLILFSLGAAAMAGLGRSGGVDPLDAPVRYATLVTPLHVGLLMLALAPAGILWRANRPLAHGLGAALLVLLLAQNAAMAREAVRVNDQVRQAIAEFAAGRRTALTRTFVHPDAALAERAYAEMAREGLFRTAAPLNPAAPPR